MDLFLDSVDIFSESPLASPLGDGGLGGGGKDGFLRLVISSPMSWEVSGDGKHC